MGRKIKNSKKRLLFLLNSLEGGGAERVLTDTVNNLDRSKYDITVQTVTDKGVYRDRLNSDIQYKSIVKCKSDFFRRFFAYIINYILPAAIVHKIFVDGDYDYEIAFLEGVPTKIIAASGNRKSVKYAWVHIDLYNTFGLDKVYRNMKAHIKSYKKYDRIICVSENVRTAFIKRFGDFDNLIVKYNVTDDKIIKEKALQDTVKCEKLHIVTVGRLEYQKGFDRLLKIHGRLVKEGFDYKLSIVGEGSRRTELEKYVKENLPEGTVELVGFTDNPYRYMAGADLIVYPSRAEGYSTVAVEAVILGKPVVASDCAGMKEIFGGSEYGMVVDNNDDALYDGIKGMLSDSSLRAHYSEKAQIRSRDFSVQARLKELEELFL